MNIIVRLPWKRPSETEENWTNEKDNVLWKCISLHSPNNDTDWSTISNRLNTSVNQCKLRASYLYKQQFLKLQNEAMSSLSLSEKDDNSSSYFTDPSKNNLNQQQILQPPLLSTSPDYTYNYNQMNQKQPTPFQFQTLDEIQKFKQCIVRNNFNWIIISNELNIPPNECRLLYHSLEPQQPLPLPYRPNLFNNNNNDDDNNNNNNYSNINYDENPITQSELIDELIEETDEFD